MRCRCVGVSLALTTITQQGTMTAEEARACRETADAFAESLRPIVGPIMNQSSRRIAAVLNERGIKPPRGKAWQSVMVLRLVKRLRAKA